MQKYNCKCIQTNPTSSLAIFVIGFNRGYQTVQLLRNLNICTSLSKYIALDGPRNSNDGLQQEKMLSLIKKEKLATQVLVGKQNLGCAKGVLNSVDALFQVSGAEIAIILEDDCWPTAFFIDMVNESKCCLNSTVLSISGQVANIGTQKSSQLSNYLMIHGWAISRKQWDRMIMKILASKEEKLIKHVSWKSRAFWKRTKQMVERGSIDTWDAHMMWANWSIKESNLVMNGAFVQNIGEQSSREEEFVSSKNETRHFLPQLTSFENREYWIERHFFGITELKALFWLVRNFLGFFAKKLNMSKNQFHEDLEQSLSRTINQRFWEI